MKSYNTVIPKIRYLSPFTNVFSNSIDKISKRHYSSINSNNY